MIKLKKANDGFMNIKSVDIIAFSYTLYFAITLSIDRDMLQGDNPLYLFMSRINSNEIIWAIVSFFISVLYFLSFLFHNEKQISLLASTLGGIFFIVLGSAFMMTYPNLGSGVFTIIGLVCFLKIGNISVSDNLDSEVKSNEKQDSD